jgi:hypothetical protein
VTGARVDRKGDADLAGAAVTDAVFNGLLNDSVQLLGSSPGNPFGPAG